MKIFTFCIIATFLLSVNVVSSQDHTKERKEQHTDKTERTSKEKKEDNSGDKAHTIELQTRRFVANSANIKETRTTQNTNIILTDESKDEAIRTTIDFF